MTAPIAAVTVDTPSMSGQPRYRPSIKNKGVSVTSNTATTANTTATERAFPIDRLGGHHVARIRIHRPIPSRGASTSGVLGLLTPTQTLFIIVDSRENINAPSSPPQWPTTVDRRGTTFGRRDGGACEATAGRPRKYTFFLRRRGAPSQAGTRAAVLGVEAERKLVPMPAGGGCHYENSMYTIAAIRPPGLAPGRALPGCFLR